MTDFKEFHIDESGRIIRGTLIEWNTRQEEGTALLEDGTQASIMQSYDGDGYLVLSNQDAARYPTKE